jgi:hypothetical protein
VFKSFARIGVELGALDDDQLQFETGVYDFGRELGGRRFWFGPRRQFTLYDGDEYDRTEILHCDFLFPAVRELEALPAEFFSTDGVTVDDFFASVERSESFAGAVASKVEPNGLWLKLELV